MDNGALNRPKVKSIFVYLKDVIRFYDTDKPAIARIVFVLELIVLFGGYYMAMPFIQKFARAYADFGNQIPGNLSLLNLNLDFLQSETYMSMVQSISVVLAILVAIKSLSFLLALFYGTHYYLGITEPSSAGMKRTGIFFSRLPKLILFNILYYVLFYIATALAMVAVLVVSLFIPLLSVIIVVFPLLLMLVDSLFVFKDLLIIEFNPGIINNFKKTLGLTKNNTKNIIVNMLWPATAGWALSSMATDINNAMLSLFITCFLQVILMLMSQRLVALMFIDAASMERRDSKKEA
jgi:hypothetical protein